MAQEVSHHPCSPLDRQPRGSRGALEPQPRHTAPLASFLTPRPLLLLPAAPSRPVSSSAAWAREEGCSSAPPFLSGSGGHVHGHCTVRPSHWVEMTAVRGVGGQGTGLKSFTYSHITRWEFRGQGSPGPLTQLEGKPNCECACWCTTGPDDTPDFLSLGHKPWLKEAQPSHRPCRVPGSGVGELWGAKVTIGVRRQDFPTKIAAPWEMYNLRTPLFFLEGEIDMYILKSFSL